MKQKRENKLSPKTKGFSFEKLKRVGVYWGFSPGKGLNQLVKPKNTPKKAPHWDYSLLKGPGHQKLKKQI